MSNMTFGVNILPANGNNSLTLGNSGQKWNLYASTINGIDINNFTFQNNSVLNLTALAEDWSNETPSTQTLTATNVTSSSNIFVGPSNTITSEEYDALAAGKIMCTGQNTNNITLTCYGTIPTIDIPINIIIVG